jgi:hypothetical protein
VQYLAIAAVGLAAGAINAAAGSGSLLTFPVLLGLGYSPLVANVSNGVGLTFGNLSASFGYRRELAGQRSRLLRLGPFSLVGGAVGAVLLLALPHQVFRFVVPGLVILAVVLLLLQPRLAKLRRGAREAKGRGSDPVHRGPGLPAAVLGTAIYGGYFGAAQGVILIAALGVFVDDTLQRLNGLKNVLASMANGAAAVVFIFRAPVAWDAALVIAGASIVGGQLGAGLGRRLSPTVLRWILIVGGAAAAVKLLV